MTEYRRLYRSRKGLVAGVCAGIAEYFAADPLVVRILCVLLVLVTCGLGIAAYVVLAVYLPKAPIAVKPVEVQPAEVHSETFGTVDVSRACDRRSGKRARAPRREGADAPVRASRGVDAYPTTGDAPPIPPAAAAAQVAAHLQTHQASAGVPGAYAAGARGAEVPAAVAAAVGVPHAAASAVAGGVPPVQAPANPPAPVAPPAPSPRPHAPADMAVRPARVSHDTSTAVIVFALIVGCALLFYGISLVVTTFVEGVTLRQCWPIALVILGIVRMVVPAHVGRRMLAFVSGFALVCAGIVALVMSIGIVSWRTLEVMWAALWPLVLLSGAFVVIGQGLHLPSVTLAAGVCFATFCFAGLALFAIPGPASELAVVMPYGREYRIPFHAVAKIVLSPFMSWA